MWQCVILGLSLALAIGAVRPPAAHAMGKLLYLDESERLSRGARSKGSVENSPPLVLSIMLMVGASYTVSKAVQYRR